MFSEKESLIVVPLAGLLSGLLPFVVIIYGIFRTLYRFKIRHLKIKLRTLPNSFKGWRIVHISDLHLGSFNYRYHILERAVKLINQLKPDIICFTGDLVNNYAWELKGWSTVLDRMSAPKGKFAVLGNHDYGDYSQWDTPKLKKDNYKSIQYFFRKIGFKLLLNESHTIDENNEKMTIIGVENWGNPPFKQYGDLKKALNQAYDIPLKYYYLTILHTGMKRLGTKPI